MQCDLNGEGTAHDFKFTAICTAYAVLVSVTKALLLANKDITWSKAQTEDNLHDAEEEDSVGGFEHIVYAQFSSTNDVPVDL